MIRRDLWAEAQAQGALRVAPQQAALGEALAQAIADRDSAIRAASVASRGISAAIAQGRKRNRSVYGKALEQGNRITASVDSALANLGGVATAHRASLVRERGVGQERLSESLANSLREMSDRKIEAAAGRAWRMQAARGEYAGEKAKIGARRADLAREQGLAASVAYGGLLEKESQREFTATQNALQREFQGTQNLLSRKNQRNLAKSAQRARRLEGETDRQFRARQKALDRANAQAMNNADNATSLAKSQRAAAAKPPSATALKGRNTILEVAQKYRQDKRAGKGMAETAKGFRGEGLPEPLLAAGADMASRGYVTPYNAQRLRQLGVTVPRAWTRRR